MTIPEQAVELPRGLLEKSSRAVLTYDFEFGLNGSKRCHPDDAARIANMVLDLCAVSLVGVHATREDVARALYKSRRHRKGPCLTDEQVDAFFAQYAASDPNVSHGGWNAIWCAYQDADAVLALPHTGQPQEGLRERALKIIANEERFAATDDKSNIELFALRVARVGTAKQILGELPLDEPILAGAIATTFSAAPASPQRAEGEK